MDKQIILNTVVTRMRAQGAPGWNPITKQCRYRTPQGNKCAIGILLTDEQIENLRSKAGVALNPYVWKLLGADKSDVNFLDDLQIAHDSAAANFIEGFEARVRDVAARYELEYPSHADA